MREYLDASSRLTIDVGEIDGDFARIDKRLQKRLGATLVNRLDGIGQRYHDFAIEGVTIVLHFDDMVGVSLYVKDKRRDDLLRKIAAECE